MRVLHLSDHKELNGGAEVIPYLLTDGLIRLGHDSGIMRLHECEAHRAQKEIQPDLWHLHNMQSHCGLGTIRYLREHGIPYVLSLHDSWHTGCPIRTLYYHPEHKRCGCWCDERRLDWVAWARESPTIACSQSQADLTMEVAGYRPTWVVPHGIDTTLFSSTRMPEEPLILCGTARKAEHWKGGWMFREAASVFRQYYPEVRVKHIEGGLSQLQLREWYRRAWFGVFPSLCAEAFGLMAVEMMACGRPVIVTDLGGYRETVAHGETGLRCPPTAQCLAEAMEELYHSGRDVLMQMGEAAVERVRERYLASRMVADTLRIYETILEVAADPVRAKAEAGWRGW